MSWFQDTLSPDTRILFDLTHPLLRFRGQGYLFRNSTEFDDQGKKEPETSISSTEINLRNTKHYPFLSRFYISRNDKYGLTPRESCLCHLPKIIIIDYEYIPVYQDSWKVHKLSKLGGFSEHFLLWEQRVKISSYNPHLFNLLNRFQCIFNSRLRSKTFEPRS